MTDLRITSRQNPRIKNVVRLRDRSARNSQKRIVIDGTREISRALAGGIVLEEVFICPDVCNTQTRRELVAQLTSQQVKIWEVTPEVLERIAYGERGEGLVAVGIAPERTLGSLAIPPGGLVGVLEGIEKPGNLGAVLRSADGAGLAALVVADGGTDLYNPNAIRASLGTIFSVPVCSAPSAEVLAWLRAQGLPIFATRVEGARNYTEVDYRRGGAIVLGSEAHGLSSAWSAPDVTAISIPMRGIADSLNVSAAAAVVFYEALRQRTAGAGNE